MKNEYKRIKKSEKETTEKYDKLKRSYDKFRDDLVNGKGTTIQKQIIDENKRLKKNEAELYEKLDKLQKLYEEAQSKGPKIEAKKSQIESLQKELHQKQIQLEKIQSTFHQKIEKYKKIIKNEEETALVTSWDDYISRLNKKLNLYKKDNLHPEEVPQAKLIAYVFQQMVISNQAEIAFLFDRSRTMPEEVFEKMNVLETKLNSCLLEKNNLENQLAQLSEENKGYTQKYESQDF